MKATTAYSVQSTVRGYRVIDDAGELVACTRFGAARMIAALMNGDPRAVAAGTDSAAEECRRALKAALRPMQHVGRPALPTAFPML